jgi:hypothetical protein
MRFMIARSLAVALLELLEWPAELLDGGLSGKSTTSPLAARQNRDYCEK